MIAGLDPQQVVAQPRPRQRLAVGRRHHDVELGIGSVRERAPGEHRLDADHRRLGRHRQYQLALDGTAAGLRHSDRNLRLQWARAGRQLVELHRKRRLARCVGGRQIVQLFANGGDLVIGQAERIARESGALLATPMVASPDKSSLDAGAP